MVHRGNGSNIGKSLAATCLLVESLLKLLQLLSPREEDGGAPENGLLEDFSDSAADLLPAS